MHRLEHRNTNGLDAWKKNRYPLLDIYDNYDNGNSTYIDTDNEVNGTDDSDNYLPPGHYVTQESSGVTKNDTHNLQRNKGVHNDDTSDNEEDEQRAANEDEESIIHIENESNDQNDLPDEPNNEIKQEDKLEDKNHSK